MTDPFFGLVESLNKGLVAEPKKIDTLVGISGMRTPRHCTFKKAVNDQ